MTVMSQFKRRKGDERQFKLDFEPNIMIPLSGACDHAKTRIDKPLDGTDTMGSFHIRGNEGLHHHQKSC